MSTGNKIFIGVAAAALAGIGVGLLLAPQSGRETRDQLRDGSNSFAKKLLKVVQRNGETLQEKADEMVDDVKATYNQAKGYARAEMDGLQEKSKKVS